MAVLAAVKAGSPASQSAIEALSDGGGADVSVDERRLGAKLHAPERDLGFRHDETGPRIASQMTGLDVLHREPQVEPTVPPLMPDGGEQDAPVSAKRRQHGDQRPVQETAEVLDGQVRAHTSP